MFAVIFYVNLEIYQLLAQTDVDSMWTNTDLCGMVRICAEWCGSVRNDADPCGMVRICADWCGIRVSPRGIRGIRTEHQGEGKLLINITIIKYSSHPLFPFVPVIIRQVVAFCNLVNVCIIPGPN